MAAGAGHKSIVKKYALHPADTYLKCRQILFFGKLGVNHRFNLSFVMKMENRGLVQGVMVREDVAIWKKGKSGVGIFTMQT